MAIERKDVFTFKYFEYGEIFHGSYRGMRYQLWRDPLEKVWFLSEEKKQEGHIKACIWPEPFSFEKTDEDKKQYTEYPFTEKGVREAIDWLNECWEKQYAGN